jgi:NAD+ synthase
MTLSLLPLPLKPIDALLIIDMQEFFFHIPERRNGLPQVIQSINHMIQHFDMLGWPVVHVISAYQPDKTDWDLKMKASDTPELILGSPESQILPEINVQPGHWQVRKTRYSAFFRTDLAERLRKAGVSRTVVCGAYTHYCVNATVFDAYANDFIPALITDSVISHLPAETDVLLDRMRRNGYHLMRSTDYMNSQ